MAKHYISVFINITAQLLSFAIFVRVILSWMRRDVSGNRLIGLIYEATEPILGFFRRYIPPIGGIVDISPIVAFFAIDIVRGILLLLLNR